MNGRVIPKPYQYRRETPAQCPQLEFTGSGTPPQGRAWCLADLLRPVSGEVFAEQYWGKFPLLIRNNNPAFFDGLTSMAEVEAYLSMAGVLEDQTVVLRSRDRPMRRKFGSLGEMYRDIRQGASLQLREMERFLAPDAPLRQLFGDMVTTLQHPGNSISCFVTPPDCELLGPHHDETEIFTLQISGSKRWKLFHRVMAHDPGIYDREELDEPAHEFTLGPGDVLYHPRGQVHEVICEDSTSFSVAIVITPMTWRLLLDQMLDAVRHDYEFIEQLPASVMLTPDAEEKLEETVREKLAYLVSRIAEQDAGAFVRSAGRDLMKHLSPPSTPHIERSIQAPRLDLDSVLYSRVGDRYLLCLEGDKALLTVAGGDTLQMPAVLYQAMHQVLTEKGAFRVSDMPDALSESSKIVLARRLVDIGVLSFTGSQTGSMPMGRAMR